MNRFTDEEPQNLRHRHSRSGDQNGHDRLPPNSPEAELAVLGCIAMAPRDCMIECEEKWGARSVFYDLRNQAIYDVYQRQCAQSKETDLVTVCEELKVSGKLDQVGGRAAIASLPEHAPSHHNLAEYSGIVWALYQRRNAIRVATEIVTAAYDDAGDADELLTKFEERVFALPRAQERGARPIGAYCAGVIDRIEHYRRGVGTLTGIPSGFAYWDKLSAGLNQELIVIGGRPGTGKTSLAMNVAENVAMGKQPLPVGVISLEMSAPDLTLRLACARARVNFHKLRTGCATTEDLETMPRVLLEVNRAPIYIDDESGLSLFEVRSRLRAMVQKFGIRLGIIDYLQLIGLPPQYYGDPVRGYGEVAKGIMASVKELKIPIILLSQLSREGGKRPGKPLMSDLRESGDIEACAHFIGILYPEKLKEGEEKEMRDALNQDPMAELELRMLMEVCKNRNGPSGTAIQFMFQRWCMRYLDRFHRGREPELPASPVPPEAAVEPEREPSQSSFESDYDLPPDP